MSYNSPSDDEVLQAIRTIMEEVGVVSSLTKLRRLVEGRLKELEPNYGITPRRLRKLAVSSDAVAVEIRSRENDTQEPLTECPVCGGELKVIKNKTLYGWNISLGYICTQCPYWTGQKKRVPVRYVFILKQH